jgi:hypothetical protein
MVEPPPPAPEPKAAGLNDLSDDALGFGALELRTARDLVLRPRAVLEAWMTQGPTGGGRYARPLRLYLALNAVLMLILFLKGGSSFMLGMVPPEMLDLEALIAASGKTRDAFMADADNWMSLVMVPVLSLFYALAAAPLLRWWDPDQLGWRRGFRAAFAWLNALTVPLLPFSWWMYDAGPGQQIGSAALFVIAIAAFMRMGAGRWYRAPAGGLAKALGLYLAIQLGGGIGFLPILLIGGLAGRFA